MCAVELGGGDKTDSIGWVAARPARRPANKIEELRVAWSAPMEPPDGGTLHDVEGGTGVPLHVLY